MLLPKNISLQPDKQVTLIGEMKMEHCAEYIFKNVLLLQNHLLLSFLIQNITM